MTTRAAGPYRYAIRDDPSLAANEERFRRTFTHAPLAQTICTLDGEIVVANERWQGYLGYGPAELLAKTVWDVTHPDDVARSREAIADLIAGRVDIAVLEKRYVRSDGEVLYARSSVALIRSDDGQPLYLNGIIEDCTEQVRGQAVLDAEMAFYDAAASDRGEDELVRVMVETVERLVPGAVASVLLVGAEPGVLRLVSAPSLPRAVQEAIGRVEIGAEAGPCGRAAHYGETIVVAEVARDTGSRNWSDVMTEHGLESCWAVPILAPNGRAVGTFTIYHEGHRRPLPEHVQLTQRLAKFLGLAITRERERNALRFDPDLELPNREGLQEVLRNRTSAGTSALFVIEIIGYGDIAAGLGRTVALAALRVARDRVSKVLAHGDMLAALERPRLAILRSPDADSGRGFVDDLAFALAAPLAVEGFPFHVRIRVGVAVEADTARLIEHAETALAHAHETGQDVVRFHRGLEAPYARRLAFAREFREALEGGDLFLEYQPKFALPGLVPVGVECLARWHGESGSDRSPGQFVPLAEQTGLMPHLTRFVLRSAADQWRRWQREGLESIMAINVSPNDLSDPRFDGALREAVSDLGIPPRSLQLEITEEALMTNPALVVPMLRRLRAAGMTIAIDDFGVGHSSLSLLRHLPVDLLKIDKSFVLAVERDPVRQAIVSSVAGLAHALGLRVVGEGVESEEAREVLERLGCDELQGFHLARPMGAEHAAAVLRRGRAG